MRMTGNDRPGVNAVLIGLACAVLAASASSAARAEDADHTDAWAQIVPREAAASDGTADQAAATPDQSEMPAEPDWSELGRLPDLPGTPGEALRAPGPRVQKTDASSWSRSDRSDGNSAVAVKTEVSPFLDTRVGANMNVLRQAPAPTVADSVSEKMLSGDTPKNSSATAWASMTGPGVPYLWDKTGLDVSMDSRTDQSKLGTTLSKSLPLWGDQYALTLQNAYRLTQPAPLPGTSLQDGRSLEIERSARFSVNHTGTSLIAGQTLSSSDEKWLGKIGAEQKLFGDITVNGTLSGAANGTTNKSLTAGFKKSW
jgi:hypothetical protein